ncbi:MAG TPA: hypothetical protein VI756_17665, partial [Blastocatellia bacterium]
PDKELDVWEWTVLNLEGRRRGAFGRVAEKTAVAIFCNPGEGNGVALTVNGKGIRLPDYANRSHEIWFRNTCDEDPGAVGTHFREIYRSGVVVAPPNEPYIDFAVCSGESIPQLICNGVFGGTV